MAADPTYAERLRAALEEKDWSQAKLVKALAARTGNAPESERSAVRGYLKDSVPRPERAAMIAEIIGVPELANVANPRQSGAARLEALLEQIAKSDVELLANQREGLIAQQQILDELRALRAALGLPDAAGRTDPTPIQRRAR